MNKLLLLLLPSVAANVILSPGIPTRDDGFVMVCSARGNVLVWRIDGDEKAVFSRMNLRLGSKIVESYNETVAFEFVAQVINFTTDSLRVPVHISTLELNKNLYGCSEIQCETDLANSSTRVNVKDGCIATQITAPPIAENFTVSPILISEPIDVTVRRGERARFHCSYTSGSALISSSYDFANPKAIKLALKISCTVAYIWHILNISYLYY